MEVVITRTSLHNDERPCDQASKPKEPPVLDFFGDEIIDSKAWVIQINSLDDLKKLFSAHGEIIIKNSDYRNMPFEIEIYDDYRE